MRSSDTFQRLLQAWMHDPVSFVQVAIGVRPDPWQADVLAAVVEHDNVAMRAAHGVGKTTLLSWIILWFLMTRPLAKVPTTAPTFNKQVRDILWAEVHHSFRLLSRRLPPLAHNFELLTTRLCALSDRQEWFAVGVPSEEPLHIEGYHAPHLLAVFDEAKGIARPTWDAVQGMRTTQEAKLVVASTPGGPGSEFHRVFTHYRQTWRSLFVIRPEALRALGAVPAKAPPPAQTYYSRRVRPQWVRERKLEWGEDSPAFIARVVGDFPDDARDVLIPYRWLSDAEDRDSGAPGERWVAVDVARYGRDRTVLLVSEGGTLLDGKTIGRTPAGPLPRGTRASQTSRRPERATTATARLAQELREKYKCVGIVVDDTGVGGGVTDILKQWGEKVIPLHFGARPTDRPTTPEAREMRTRRHLVDSTFVNLKAQLGWGLRGAFERGDLALGRLPREVLDPLIAQVSLVKYERDTQERLRVIDPDDQDDLAAAAGNVEGRRSPDHFHALLLLWAKAGNALRSVEPRGSAVRREGRHLIVGRPGRGSGLDDLRTLFPGLGRRVSLGARATWYTNRYQY